MYAIVPHHRLRRATYACKYQSPSIFLFAPNRNINVLGACLSFIFLTRLNIIHTQTSSHNVLPTVYSVKPNQNTNNRNSAKTHTIKEEFTFTMHAEKTRRKKRTQIHTHTRTHPRSGGEKGHSRLNPPPPLPTLTGCHDWVHRLPSNTSTADRHHWHTHASVRALRHNNQDRQPSQPLRQQRE